MSKLTYKQRKNLPVSSFVFKKKRAYPLDTANRARNALARVSAFGTPEEKAKVRSVVHSKYPQIGKKKGYRSSSDGAVKR